jgi:hypothetical protein
VALEVNKARERAKQTHRLELGNEVVHQGPVLPDIVDENNETLVIGDHLAESWPRVDRHWVQRRHIGPLDDVCCLEYRRPLVLERQPFWVRDEERYNLVRVSIQERGDEFEVRWCTSESLSEGMMS